MVIIVRTHLETQRVGHVVLFSSDLSLDAERLVDYYALRFQIEFTFRDAKQYFGLEDFMGVKETSVANAVGLSFFMVNLSTYLLGHLRASYPGAGVNDLKSYCRARHYIAEILKFVPENLLELLTRTYLSRFVAAHSSIQGKTESLISNLPRNFAIYGENNRTRCQADSLFNIKIWRRY